MASLAFPPLDDNELDPLDFVSTPWTDTNAATNTGTQWIYGGVSKPRWAPYNPGGGASAWDDITGKPATFAPSTHKSSHATGGADALTPADISAVAAPAAASSKSGTYTLIPADNGKKITAGAALALTLPDSGMTGMRVWVMAEAGDITIVGNLYDAGTVASPVTSIVGSDGQCELINLAGAWYFRRGTNAPTTDEPLPISKGGTGGPDAATALANLGAARAIEIKSANFTAAIGGRYLTEGTVTITDPAGTTAGQSYEVWIGSGTATMGGTAYAPSRFSIRRRYTGSAWATPSPYLSDALDFSSAARAATRANLEIGISGRLVLVESDFLTNTTAHAGVMTGTALSSGAAQASSFTNANHPGAITLRDSTTADGGYRLITATSALIPAGGEVAVMIFQLHSARTTQTIRWGFHDSSDQTAPTLGAYLEMVGNGTSVVITGKTRNGGTTSSTGTTYTAALSTWFSAKVEMTSTSSATFTVYSEAGAVLWTQTLTTNNPTTNLGYGIVATESTTDAATNMISVDYHRMEINRPLTR